MKSCVLIFIILDFEILYLSQRSLVLSNKYTQGCVSNNESIQCLAPSFVLIITPLSSSALLSGLF